MFLVIALNFSFFYSSEMFSDMFYLLVIRNNFIYAGVLLVEYTIFQLP